MDYLLKRLEWDSIFFGYEVAKVNIQSKIDDEILLDIIHSSKGFKLVYLFADCEIFRNVEPEKFRNVYHVDTKLTFALDNIKTKRSYPKTCEEFSFVKINEICKSLKSLVLLSGKYSRYFIDKHFVQGEFERLYLKWIEKSLSSDSNKMVFGFKDGEKVIAFVSINILELTVIIELIAVDENYQGKGIGKMLINEVLVFCQTNNIDNLEVVTQFENESACRLYESCGMQVVSKQFLYHLWN